ncbi:MAG: hypothetical protein AB2705_20315 [Candidatus Thiodiazotropha sp.]
MAKLTFKYIIFSRLILILIASKTKVVKSANSTAPDEAARDDYLKYDISYSRKVLVIYIFIVYSSYYFLHENNMKNKLQYENNMKIKLQEETYFLKS